MSKVNLNIVFLLVLLTAIIAYASASNHAVSPPVKKEKDIETVLVQPILEEQPVVYAGNMYPYYDTISPWYGSWWWPTYGVYNDWNDWGWGGYGNWGWNRPIRRWGGGRWRRHSGRRRISSGRRLSGGRRSRRRR